jgi:predicted nucleic acid-binding Zn ribbon protein
MEFVLKVGGPQVLPPSLDSVFRLPWNPEEPDFTRDWERILLRHGLPVPVAPADPSRPHIIRVPAALLSCIRLLLEAALRAGEGRPDVLRTVVAHFELAPGALKFLPYLANLGVRLEDLASVDPTMSGLGPEALTGLAIAALAQDGNCSGFLSVVHQGALRFLSPPTRSRQLLAWGWYSLLALTLTTETPQRRCRRCGTPVPEGRRYFCSARCSDTMRKITYRHRKRLKS